MSLFLLSAAVLSALLLERRPTWQFAIFSVCPCVSCFFCVLWWQVCLSADLQDLCTRVHIGQSVCHLASVERWRGQQRKRKSKEWVMKGNGEKKWKNRLTNQPRDKKNYFYYMQTVWTKGIFSLFNSVEFNLITQYHFCILGLQKRFLGSI